MIIGNGATIEVIIENVDGKDCKLYFFYYFCFLVFAALEEREEGIKEEEKFLGT